MIINEIFFLLIKEFQIKSINQYNELIQLREHSILSLSEYAELMQLIGGEEDVAIQAMFLGFSAESIKADRSTFYYFDELSNSLFPNAVRVYKDKKLIPYDYYSELKNVSIEVGKDICGLAIQKKEPMIIENINDEPRYLGIVDKKIGLKINSIMAIPLIIDNKAFGVIEVATSDNSRYLSNIDYSVFSIITQFTLIIMEKAKLYNWAVTDNLTQIFNFHYLQVALEKELLRSKRYDQNIGVMLIDIDNFKSVNDVYGHPFGNMVLKGVAEIIRESIRDNIDIPVRYGGDEFLILLPTTPLQGAKTLANRLLERMREKKYKYDNGKEVTVTFSIGITAAKKKQIIDKEKLIKKADAALYSAKAQGKNCLVSN